MRIWLSQGMSKDEACNIVRQCDATVQSPRMFANSSVLGCVVLALNPQTYPSAHQRKWTPEGLAPHLANNYKLNRGMSRALWVTRSTLVLAAFVRESQPSVFLSRERPLAPTAPRTARVSALPRCTTRAERGLFVCS
eukprot:4462364-Prymnesium_polylepis.1